MTLYNTEVSSKIDYVFGITSDQKSQHLKVNIPKSKF